MKELIYVIGNMSQFHQIVFISILASIITNLIKLIVHDKPAVVYRLIVMGIYIVLEIGLDTLIIHYFIGRLDASTIFAEILTVISGVTLSYMIYETYKSIWEDLKRLWYERFNKK